MLNLQDYLAMDATAMADGLREKQFSSKELMACAIQQAETLNPLINAINHPLFEKGLSKADVSAEDTSKLPLPFLIKDLSDLAGAPISRGSELFTDSIAQTSASIIDCYLNAGLIPIGKTNTPEFGLTITTEPQATGVTRNPWNLQYSTGGSSGGSAAAVAAGIVPVAHATDGGGSIRIPASCCGLVGLKPSRGLTMIESGLTECWSGMSVGHVLSRSVRDSARFLELISLDKPKLFPRPDVSTSFSKELADPAAPLKIAVQKSHPFDENVDPECLSAIDTAAQLCTDLGHQVDEIQSLPDYRAASKAMNILIALHTYQAVNKRVTELGLDLNSAPMEISTRQMAQLGATLGIDDYTMAIETLHRIANAMEEFHGSVDMILAPVLTKTPAQLGWLDMNSEDGAEYIHRYKSYGGFTALHNGTGQPAISIPMTLSAQGLPIGVMFSAAWGADLKLLQLAAQIEQARPWQQLAPLATADSAALAQHKASVSN